MRKKLALKNAKRKGKKEKTNVTNGRHKNKMVEIYSYIIINIISINGPNAVVKRQRLYFKNPFKKLQKISNWKVQRTVQRIPHVCHVESMLAILRFHLYMKRKIFNTYLCSTHYIMK